MRKAIWAALDVSAFPDLHFDIDQIFGEGDFVTTRWTATGTQRGELMGIKPTNRRTVTHGWQSRA